MDALILFSHGSLLCGAGEALEAHAGRLQARGDYAIIEIGYLNYSEPSFAEAINRAVARGATRAVVAPYFLVPGYFVSTSLPKEIDKAQAAHPALAFTVGAALGHDDALVDALLEAAQTARPASQWRAPLLRASASCRPNPVCPLYGTPACPKVPVPPQPTEEITANVG